MGGIRTLGVALFLASIGCAPTAPPPPSYAVRTHSQPAVAQRWEQFCEQAANVSQASWLAASRGTDGWELVGMYNGVLCYKRPELPTVPQNVEPPAPPPAMISRAPAPASTPAQPTPVGTVPRIIDPGF
ncbi:MAG: hypothetical protein IPK82_28050 [Polyangiaceae bacterium]|nr:hypothetical protein [Polyangiaceae bacterium]